jgi:hypothetical protein
LLTKEPNLERSVATEDPQSDTDWKQKYLEAQSEIERIKFERDKFQGGDELKMKKIDELEKVLNVQFYFAKQISSLTSEITALRGTIEYWKLRLSECENFNQKREGEVK